MSDIGQATLDGWAPDRARRLARLRAFARLMDASIGIPGTRFRIGVDPLIGLVPVVGDWAGAALSCWILVQAHTLGARRQTMARMAANVALEAVIGMVPLIGDAFDAWFRANQRNVELLQRDLGT